MALEVHKTGSLKDEVVLWVHCCFDILVVNVAEPKTERGILDCHYETWYMNALLLPVPQVILMPADCSLSLIVSVQNHGTRH